MIGSTAAMAPRNDAHPINATLNVACPINATPNGDCPINATSLFEGHGVSALWAPGARCWHLGWGHLAWWPSRCLCGAPAPAPSPWLALTLQPSPHATHPNQPPPQ